MVGHWNRVPRDVVTAVSLSEFTQCLDNALRHWVWFFGPLWSQELDSVIEVGPF